MCASRESLLESVVGESDIESAGVKFVRRITYRRPMPYVHIGAAIGHGLSRVVEERLGEEIRSTFALRLYVSFLQRRKAWSLAPAP